MVGRAWAIVVGALLPALLAAAPDEADAPPPRESVDASPPRGPLIRAGTVRGAEQVDADDLTAGLSQHPPRGWWPFRDNAEYDPLQLTLDRRRIVSFYRARGFFSAKVIDVEVEPYEDGVRVDFVVEEGPVYTLRSVQVAGLPESEWWRDTGRPALRPKGLKVGEPFRYERYEAFKAEVRNRLVHASYAHATVDGEVILDEDEAKVDVRLAVDAGPAVRFGKIDIQPGPLPEASIRARLTFATGDPYSPAALAQTESRIYELGLVGVVSFYVPTEGRPPVADVHIEVRPGRKNELRIGLGVARQNPNYQTRLRTGYVRRDFFDPLVRLSSEVRPAILYRPGDSTFAFGIEWSAALTREDLFTPRLTGTVEVQYNLLQYEAYSTLGPVFRLIVARPFIDDRLRLSLAANVALLGFPRVDGVIPRDELTGIGLPECVDECLSTGKPGGLTLVYLEPALTYDGRDDPLDPSRGGLARANFTLGRTLNAPGINWVKVTPDVRGYLRLGTRRAVLAARARLGIKLLPGEPLPAPQRYFGGGSESQRGFTIRQLSPFFGTGADAVPVGGESLFELSSELRFKLFRLFGMWWGTVLFVDAADVGADFTDLRFEAPHVAVGSGLRLYTPIGPLRFDVGYRLNRVAPGIEPGGSDRFALHLSLGEAF